MTVMCNKADIHTWWSNANCSKQYKVDNRFYIDIVYTFVQGGVPSDQRTSDLENPLQILWYAGIYPFLQGYRHSSFADSLFAPHEAQVTGGP